ncbi:carboxypeptidase regulatory-like domain-containing protein [Lutibacter sp. TH_r2]|uniref:carboxypeptidase regulatory-like domain-containing protein n=1 Tax=Lutibacter sp. TH_r2 TaxID=3082083 RepID=UPI002952ABF0|nr:carboxypeptidase regulatory-like domain-containing protein [Lutibacter sp. TH_r2]MDV7187061.1 carboxypeptidase regulatory-like domain-containing protein [Lutibacter sp. TH_r2]
MKIFKLAVLFLIAINFNSDTLTTNNCTQKVSGKITTINNLPIANSFISVFLDGVEVKTTTTNSNGEYSLILNCNNTYGIVASAPNFLSNRKIVSTSNNSDDSKTQNFILKPECYQKITGVVVNDLTQEKMEDVKVTLHLDGEEIESTQTNSNGSYSFQTICNSNYYIITSKNNFINDFYEFSTSTNNNEIIKYNPVLEPECIQTISGTIRNKITKEPLSVELRLLLNNVIVETIKVNNDGKYFIQFQCTTNYRIIASKPDYKDDSYNFLTDYIENKQPDYYNLKKDLFLEPNECFQVVLGRVLNEKNNPISNSNVSLLYQNHEIKTFQTKPDGSFFFNIKCGKEYKLKASKENLTTEIVSFKATEIKDATQNKDIYLKELDCNQTITGVITDVETKQPIANTQVKLFEGASEVNTTTTDTSGKYSFTANCEADYKITASNVNYNSNEIKFATDKKRDATSSKNIELKELDCNQTITGVITDADTKQPIANTKVKLFEGASEVNTTTTDTSGKYSFTVNCEADYKITASNVNYNSNEIKFATDKKRDATSSKNIELKELDCNQTITGVITNADTKQPIANTQVKLFEGASEVNTTTTDTSGKYSFTVNCEADYKITASNVNYNSNEIKFATDKKRDATSSKNIELKELDCNQTITGVITNADTKQPIANTQVKLFKGASEVNTTTTDTSGKYSFTVNCEADYKITASNVNYNSNEIKFATDKKRDATSSKNIELKELDCNQTITGVITNADTKQPIANTQVKLFKGASEVNTTTTDTSGKYSFTVNCEADYKITASNVNYNSNEIKFATDKKRDATSSKNIELKELNCNQTITGLITDADTKQPIANTQVKLFEGTSEVNTTTTDTSGKYSFTVNCEADYKITASNVNYNSNEVKFATDKKRDATSSKNIELKELNCNQTITGVITDVETKQPVANTQVKLFEGASEVNTTTTDTSGKYSFTVNCELTYTLNTESENYNTASKALTTSNKRDASNKLNFELSSKVCNQEVTGIIRDKLTKKPLAKTTISLYQNNKVISTQTVGADGVYHFDLECSSSYKLTVFKNNNLESFRLKTALQNGRTLTLHIDIDPPNCIQYINGITLENISKEPIPNTKISLLNYSNEVKTTTSDSNGNFYFEIDCNKTYTVIANKEKYTKSQLSIVSNNLAGAPHTVELILEPIIEIKEKNGIYYIETKPIVFELDEYEIKDNVKTELNKVLFNMNQNPQIKISINFHTDSRGPDNYNMTLSQNRADAVKEYLIENGINSNRISAKGYGETKLVNKCKNDVKCSEAEHAQNRRTEFIIENK